MGPVFHQKVERLDEEVSFLERNRERFVSELPMNAEIRRLVERAVYLCAEMVLDVADLIIVARGWPKPGTYREAIEKLGEMGMLPAEFAQPVCARGRASELFGSRLSEGHASRSPGISRTSPAGLSLVYRKGPVPMTSPWERIADRLRAQPVSFAYLFGSQATGKASPRSDWDVAVYLSALPEEDLTWEKFRIEDVLARALGTDAVQVVILNRLDAPLLEYEVISKGNVLCDSDPEARFLYEATALRRFHDWRYWLDRHMAMLRVEA